MPKINYSISKVNFYATRTTYARYIPLCAKINLHGFRELLSINKRNKFKQKTNPGQPKGMIRRMTKKEKYTSKAISFSIS